MDEKQDKGFPENLHDQDTEQEEQMRKDMSEEQCCELAAEKGFQGIGAHRCNQHGTVGSDLDDREWLEKQTASLPGAGLSFAEEEEAPDKRSAEEPIRRRDDE